MFDYPFDILLVVSAVHTYDTFWYPASVMRGFIVVFMAGNKMTNSPDNAQQLQPVLSSIIATKAINSFSFILLGPWCAQDKQKFWSPTTDYVQNSDGVESTTSTCTTENDLRTGSEGNMDTDLASSFEFESQELPSTPKANSASADLSTVYRLHGVVNHLGHNAFGGHFLTDILDPEEDRWLRCDDSLVTDVSFSNYFVLAITQLSVNRAEDV